MTNPKTRFFLVLVLSLLSLRLVACSSTPEAEPVTDTPAFGASSDELSPSIDFTEIVSSQPWQIAFIPKFKYYGETGKLSSYWQPAWDGAQQARTDFNVQVELIVANTLGNTDAEYVEPQIRLVADLIETGEVDGIVIAPFDSNRLAPVLEQAVEAGIHVIAMDTPVNSDQLLSTVMFDNFTAGKTMGEWVVRQLDGKGKVLILDGPQDQQNAVDRRNGFLAGLKSGDIEVLNTKSADWEIEPAREITADWLKQYTEVDAIIAANDNMALGAAQAIADTKRTGILVTGFDATDPALQAIAIGEISATVDQAPGEQVRLAIQLLIRHIENSEEFPPIIYLPRIPLVTQENVQEYLVQRGLK